MARWTVMQAPAGDTPVRHKDGVLVVPTGNWYAVTEGDPTVREAIGHFVNRPDLEAALVKKGVGFMDLEN